MHIHSTSTFVALSALTAGGYVLRRLGERGGATDAEVRAVLPGDDLVPEPMLQTTHAITIHAGPDAVWPWLVQMGLYRAGWYADQGWWDAPLNRYLRTLTRSEAERTGYGRREEPSADHIVQEFQDLKVGDIILDGPPGTAWFRVVSLEPGRALVLHSTTHMSHILPRRIQRLPALGLRGAFTWSFVLEESMQGATRLILRTRMVAKPRAMWSAFLPMAWAVDYLTTRRQLRGIRQRVENHSATTRAGSLATAGA
jgi:hypothetical protein